MACNNPFRSRNSKTRISFRGRKGERSIFDQWFISEVSGKSKSQRLDTRDGPGSSHQNQCHLALRLRQPRLAERCPTFNLATSNDAIWRTEPQESISAAKPERREMYAGWIQVARQPNIANRHRRRIDARFHAVTSNLRHLNLVLYQSYGILCGCADIPDINCHKLSTLEIKSRTTRSASDCTYGPPPEWRSLCKRVVVREAWVSREETNSVVMCSAQY